MQANASQEGEAALMKQLAENPDANPDDMEAKARDAYMDLMKETKNEMETLFGGDAEADSQAKNDSWLESVQALMTMGFEEVGEPEYDCRR